MPGNLENSAVATGLDKVSFHSNPKECSSYHTIALISQASKVNFKILQARPKQYMYQELPDAQSGFRKGRGTRNHVTKSVGSLKKQERSRKHIYVNFMDYAKDFDHVTHNRPWKILQEMEIPDHLTYLLRNLYAGQEAKFSIEHGTDCFQIGKGVCQGCILTLLI